MMMTYQAWCVAQGVTHAHCPNDCEHPQPRMVEGKMVCGRCLVYEGKLVECIPCTPATCAD